MKQRLNQLWRDTRGEISAAAMILIVTIVCIGAIVGLATIRDYIVQEFGDMAVGIENLDQSYSYTIEIDTDDDMVADVTISTSYEDPGTDLLDEDGEAPACLTFVDASAEGSGAPSPSPP